MTNIWLRTFIDIHKENMVGIPASGRKEIWEETVVSRFDANDRIAEEWVVSNIAG